MSIETEVSPDEGVATVRIDRPEKRNALSMPMLRDIREAFEELPSRDGVRVLVVTGVEDVFSAGADIREFAKRVDDPTAEAAFVESIHGVYEAVESCPIPVIAAVNGQAVGAGCEIALASDLRVATRDASLLISEIDLAIVPPFERLSEYLGRARVRELCLTGRPLPATEADAAGVFNEVVARDEFDDAVDGIVTTLASKSPHALRRTKEAFKFAETATKDQAIDYRKRLEYECYDHPDFEESVEAFVEGDSPDFSP